MHILIATDGHLDPEKATEIAARLYRPGDEVTVLTAVSHPGEFPHRDAKQTTVERAAAIAHEAGAGVIGFASGAVAAERLTSIMGATQPHNDDNLNQYFTTTAQQRLKDLMDRLEENGITAKARWTPTDNQTASAILNAVATEGFDMMLIGSRDRRFEGVLGSTVTRLIAQAEIPVVVVK